MHFCTVVQKAIVGNLSFYFSHQTSKRQLELCNHICEQYQHLKRSPLMKVGNVALVQQEKVFAIWEIWDLLFDIIGLENLL